MDSVEVTDATKDDIPSVLELAYELGRPRPQSPSDADEFGRVICRYISDPDKQVLVARAGQTGIVGMACVVFLHRLNRRGYELYMPELVVRKEYQNRGIGRKLVEHCVSEGRRRRCYRIRLESGNWREGSHRFYTRTGFVQDSLSFSKSLD